MTRKDYVLIAAAIGLTQQDFQTRGIGALALQAGIIVRLGRVLAKDNPAFDTARFYRKCGLHHTGGLPA